MNNESDAVTYILIRFYNDISNENLSNKNISDKNILKNQLTKYIERKYIENISKYIEKEPNLTNLT
jgi:Fe-S cluster biosynthesis and repair protein YggX